jgi:nicotinamide mononucleotide transporter
MLTFFKDWTLFEKVWLGLSTLTLVVLELIWHDQWLGFISAITGILCVVLAAKGKRATFYFGIVNAITYAIVAFGYHLYGEAMLNALFYLPTQFIGLYLWSRHRKNAVEAVNGEDIFTRRLSLKQWLIGTPIVLAATGGYILFLAQLNAAQIHLDGVAVVLSITAQVLMLMRFAEQWVLWIVVNVITIALWTVTLAQSGGNDYALLVMWIAYLVNSVYGYVNWRRLSDPKRATLETPPTAAAAYAAQPAMEV